jgi:hypothetical protein
MKNQIIVKIQFQLILTLHKFLNITNYIDILLKITFISDLLTKLMKKDVYINIEVKVI